MIIVRRDGRTLPPVAAVDSETQAPCKTLTIGGLRLRQVLDVHMPDSKSSSLNVPFSHLRRLAAGR
jgi:hypothetical protein